MSNYPYPAYPQMGAETQSQYFNSETNNQPPPSFSNQTNTLPPVSTDFQSFHSTTASTVPPPTYFGSDPEVPPPPTAEVAPPIDSQIPPTEMHSNAVHASHRVYPVEAPPPTEELSTLSLQNQSQPQPQPQPQPTYAATHTPHSYTPVESGPPNQPQTPVYTPQTPATPASTSTPEVDYSMSADKRFLRMTLNTIPQNTALLNKCKIPFGCNITPFLEDESDVPVVDYEQGTIVRCRRCRTYINPFVQFFDNGRRWRCNMCFLLNQVSSNFYCSLDENGKRRDLQMREELSHGTVEYIASSEYSIRAPPPAVYLFVIDVSMHANASGMVQTVATAIKNSLDKIAGDERTMVGFLAVNSAVCYFNLNADQTQPQMLVCSDLEEVFLPCPDDLLVNLQDSRESVNSLLDSLPKMFVDSPDTECALGSSVEAIQLLMQRLGGKALVFSCVLPTLGKGKLRNREDRKLYGTDAEKSLLLPAQDMYKEKAVEFSRQMTCVDLFLCPATYVDVATLSSLSKYSGGEVLYYPSFDAAQDASVLTHDIQKRLTQGFGYEAVLRTRCSKGLKVVSYHGSFFIRTTDLLSVPNIHPGQSFGIHFTLDEGTIQSSFVSIQCAVLFTNSMGERRIRVNTAAFPVSSLLGEVFKHSDVNAVVNLLAKVAIDKALTTRIQDARELIFNRCVEILATYRQAFTQPTAEPQKLLLPESLKLLPLYTLSLLKSRLFKQGSSVLSDERTFLYLLFKSMSLDKSLVYLYPLLLPLHKLKDDEGCVQEGDAAAGVVRLPDAVSLTADNIEAGGVYLLENGREALMWVGRSVDPMITQALFGRSTICDLSPAELTLTLQDNNLSQRVWNIIRYLRKQRHSALPVRVVAPQHPAEHLFRSWLLEDRVENVMGYWEFINHLHKEISSKTFS